MSSYRRLDQLERRLEDAGELLEQHRALKGRRGADLRPYQGQPTAELVCRFARAFFRFEATDQQRRIFRMYCAGGWAAVRSAVGIGKTVAVAVVVLFHVYARRGLVVSLASSDRQVKELLWGAIRQLWSGSGLPGELFQQALVLGGQTRAIGFVTTDPAKLRGWHHRRLLVAIDESQGVPPWVWENLAALAIGEENQVLAIGNPGPPVGPWYNVFQSPQWSHLVLSAIDHPNIQEGREVIPGGPSRGQIERIRQERGENSSAYRSLVLGEFSEEVGESLFERAWIDAAIERWRSGVLEAEARNGRYWAAIDVARFGADATALVLRQGPVVREVASWHRCDLMETVDRVVRTLAGWRVAIWPWRPPHEGAIPPGEMWRYPEPDPANAALAAYGLLAEAGLTVDTIGVGSGVYDVMHRRGFRVREFIASHAVSAQDSYKFMNKRAEAAFTLMRKFQDGTIAIPPHEQLIEELLAIKWFQNPSGKIQIAAKDELRALLGRSPDFFDALAMVMDESHRGAAIGVSVRVLYG